MGPFDPATLKFLNQFLAENPTHDLPMANAGLGNLPLLLAPTGPLPTVPAGSGDNTKESNDKETEKLPKPTPAPKSKKSVPARKKNLDKAPADKGPAKAPVKLMKCKSDSGTGASNTPPAAKKACVATIQLLNPLTSNINGEEESARRGLGRVCKGTTKAPIILSATINKENVPSWLDDTVKGLCSIAMGNNADAWDQTVLYQQWEKRMFLEDPQSEVGFVLSCVMHSFLLMKI